MCKYKKNIVQTETYFLYVVYLHSNRLFNNFETN